MYYFGVYHWRRRFSRLALAALALTVGALGLRRWRRAGDTWALLLGGGLVAWGGETGRGPLRRLLDPPPWHVETHKYETLATMLPLESAARVADLGCGTGRSLVGLAPAIPADTTVVGFDVFDDRVILGNGPALAQRNAAVAGIAVEPVRGDAAALPLAADSVDVLTACRVLHDLPKPAAETALSEVRRVLAPDGTLGVLELPLPHDADVPPTDYWTDLVADAGFTVTERRTLDDRYTLLAATLAD